MEQHISKIGIGYRGRHRKYIAIYNATVLSLQQYWFFDGKNVFLNIAERLKELFYIYILFVFKTFSVWILRAALCEIILYYTKMCCSMFYLKFCATNYTFLRSSKLIGICAKSCIAT
jgi:hypothetical protein